MDIQHNRIDNLQGQLFGIIMVAFGLSLLHSAGLIIGQMAGVAFLLNYACGINFSLAFMLLNIPFYVLALLRMGYAFTLNTLLAVSAVSFLTNIAGDYISYRHVDPFAAAIIAGLCVGIGMIGLYRHHSSCGGMSILAAYIQERTGFKAGWMMLLFDLLLFMSSFMLLQIRMVLYSLLSALAMNLFIAWNHRKEWYVAR